MKLTPNEFIQLIKEGKTERELNKLIDAYIDSKEVTKLIRWGHTALSAREHLETDYTNGFTICGNCGSYYDLGKGFTKHISNGCLHCEGDVKHRVYHVNASKPSEGGFAASWMSVMFDDGMSYCKDRLQIEKYSKEVSELKNNLNPATL